MKQQQKSCATQMRVPFMESIGARIVDLGLRFSRDQSCGQAWLVSVACSAGKRLFRNAKETELHSRPQKLTGRGICEVKPGFRSNMGAYALEFNLSTCSGAFPTHRVI